MLFLKILNREKEQTKMANKHLSKGQDVFYKYPELYQLRNKKTGRKLLNCARKYDCERELRAIKIKDWKLAQDLVIIKLDRKEELQWASN